MSKLWILGAVIAGVVAQQAPTLIVRVAGATGEVKGTVVGGVDYVPLKDISTLLGAKLTIDKPTPTDREATLELSAPKNPFVEDPDTVVPIDGDTSLWLPVANSGGKLRFRDFVRPKDGWTATGELDVAKESMTVLGRPPRDRVTLDFYAVFKDAAGKSIGRTTFSVKNVSYEGGRYPIALYLYLEGNRVLPATVGIRFNGVREQDPDRGG